MNYLLLFVVVVVVVVMCKGGMAVFSKTRIQFKFEIQTLQHQLHRPLLTMHGT